ncbi:MAG: EAL domain-containing protein [Gemmatimonadota bacterium]
MSTRLAPTEHLTVLATPERPPARGRILVVEDDDAMRRTIARILSSEWDVTTVADGHAAMEAFRSEDFQVVISDLAMPTMNGLVLLEQIRRLSDDIPVILVTGSPSMDSAIDAVGLRAFKYLQKPFTAEILRETVRDASHHARMAQIRREALIIANQPDPNGIQKLRDEVERARRTLWLAYQPIVNRGKVVVAYEALMRWRDGEFRGPVELLAAADQVDAGDELGKQIRSLAPQPFVSRPELHLFLNLDPSQIDRAYITRRDDQLAQMADRVVLELTEHSPVRGVGNVEATILELKSIGYRLAVDDLGAGYSGLSSFARIGPQFVKLDRNLVHGASREAERQRVIYGINKLCHELGIQVVAEGIEDGKDFDMLLALDCDLFQGYFIGRPEPLE